MLNINQNIYSIMERANDCGAPVFEAVSWSFDPNSSLAELINKRKGLVYRRNSGKYEADGVSVEEADRVIADITQRISELKGGQVTVTRGKGTAVGIDGMNKADEVVEERMGVERTWNMMYLNIRQVLRGRRKALIICGAPGMGKTFRVMEEIYKDPRLEEGRNLFTISGNITKIGLYQELYRARNGGLLVFDDTDNMYKDPNLMNFLKGALDTSKSKVSYAAGGQPPLITHYDTEEGFEGMEGEALVEELPRFFEFKGRCIFITNLGPGQIENALKSRATVIDIDFNLEERIDVLNDIKKYVKLDQYKPTEEEYELGFKMLMELCQKHRNWVPDCRSLVVAIENACLIIEGSEAEQTVLDNLTTYMKNKASTSKTHY